MESLWMGVVVLWLKNQLTNQYPHSFIKLILLFGVKVGWYVSQFNDLTSSDKYTYDQLLKLFILSGT